MADASVRVGFVVHDAYITEQGKYIFNPDLSLIEGVSRHSLVCRFDKAVREERRR